MVGQTISHYKVLAELGEGGMGVVYKAEDTKLRRVVALKFLRPEVLESEEHKARFLVEAQAAASLNHPNICTVYEIDEAEGQTFLAMAYVEGDTVSQKIKQRPLPLDEVLDIAIQAGEGLQAAHEKGIVHRDIKSSNLMLTPQGRVQVMDFGLARLSDRSRLTMTGSSLGTPAYMSPEQAKRRPADRRADIWSLGVVIYEMATGRLPFEGEREQAVLYSIINEAHEPITALRVGVPTELDRIVAKAMAKRPEERYQHVDEMLVDLRALRESPLQGLRETAPARPRRRSFVLAAAGLLVALLALVVGLNPGGLRGRILGGAAPTAIESIVVLPVENLSGDPEQEYFADGMTAALITDLAKIGGLRVISRRSALRYKGTDKPLWEIAGELNVDAVIESSALRAGDRVRITAQLIEAETDQNLWAESYERDFADVLLVQSEVARAVVREIKGKLTPEDETRLADARRVNPETHEAYLKGMFHLSKATPEGTEKGMAYLLEAVEKDPEDPLAYAWLAYGYITIAHGPAPTLDALPRAKAAAMKALELDDTLVEALPPLGFLKGYYDWDWEEADQVFLRAIELNPSSAMAHYWYSWQLALFGRMEEAIAEHIRARQADPLNPLHTAWLGELYRWVGRYDEAIAEARKAIELAPNYPIGYFVLGSTYFDQGRYKEAIETHQRLAAVSPQWRYALASTYARAGRKDEARKIAAELEETEPNPAWRAWSLAVIYTDLGEKDEAFRWLNYEHPHCWLPWIRVIPEFVPLRGDPRYDDLLRRMNLTPFEGFEHSAGGE